MLALAQNDVTRNNDAMLLAAAYLRLGWNDICEASINSGGRGGQWIKYEPRNPALYFNQGLAELAMGDEEHARLTYDAGISVRQTTGSDVRKPNLTKAFGDLQNLVKQSRTRNRRRAILKALQSGPSDFGLLI